MNVFGRDRLNYVVIDFDEIEAGALVRRYGLRGFDAVHLSSAKLLNDDENITLFFFHPLMRNWIKPLWLKG
ncbi:MAG: hypothetical protein ACOYW7_10810 [Nitrospirota bacterium]